MIQQKYNNLIISLTIAVFALPLLVEIVFNGWTRVISFFAADSFYYLSVARNFAEQGFFTFDQQYPTNGFHPLWQVALGVIYRLGYAIHMSPSALLVTTMLVNIISISLAIFLLGKAFLSDFKRIPFVFLILPIGVYGLLTVTLDSFTGSLWTNANGMESSFAILAYAAAIWVMVKPNFLKSYVSAVLIGLLLSFIFLARLDHGFFAIAFFAILGLQMIVYREWSTFKFLFVCGLVAASVVAAYLLSNYLSLGVFLPVSGNLKSTYPNVVNDKIPVVLSILSDPNYPSGPALLTRFNKIALPMIPAVGFLLWSIYLLWKRKLTQLDTAFAVSSLSIILLGLYNFFYVPLWWQGEWYFPVSILFMSLVLVYVVGRLAARFPENPGRLRFSAVSAAVLGIVCIAFFVSFYWKKETKFHYTKFITDVTPSMAQYYNSEKIKLIEVDDGIVGYATGYPTMSWLGFTLDVEGVQAKRRGQLLDLAIDRGFDRFASVNYFDARGLDSSTPSDIVKERLGKTFFLTPKQVEPFAFHVEFVSKDGRIAIIRVMRQ